jgi:hypothetical protein
MKHNKIISLGAVAIALAAVIGIAASSFAATDTQTTPSATVGQNQSQHMRRELTAAQKQEMKTKKQEMEAKRKAIETALANNDYQAWLTAVGSDSDKAKLVTADKFPLLVQAYQLEQEGKAKLDQARQIREQLGLKGPEQGKGFGRGPALDGDMFKNSEPPQSN